MILVDNMKDHALAFVICDTDYRTIDFREVSKMTRKMENCSCGKHAAALGIVGAFLFFCLSQAAASQSLIADGGFETPVVTPGTFVSYDVGDTFGPWTVVGPSGGNVSIVSTTYTADGFSFPAHSGAAFLDLTGGPDTGLAQGVAQTVSTAVGTTYRLGFWVGNVYNPGGPFGTTSTVKVYINGDLVGAATNSRGQGTSVFWQRFSGKFVARQTSTTISFVNGDPGGANDEICGVDDISLVAVTPGAN